MQLIMDEAELDRAVAGLCEQILDSYPEDELALVGILRRGVPLAGRIREKLVQNRPTSDPPSGTLDIRFYRDDLSMIDVEPVVGPMHLEFQVDGAHILLVDDVLFTGRTARAALESLFDFGRPKTVELAVLIDRGHRQLPIQATYTGKVVPTQLGQSIEVHIPPVDSDTGVYLKTPE